MSIHQLPLDVLRLVWKRVGAAAPIRHVCRMWARNYSKQKVRISLIETTTLFQWIIDRGYKFSIHTCNSIAHGGNVKVLEYAVGKGARLRAETCAYAARSGHRQIILWIRENHRLSPVYDDMLASRWVAKTGNLEMLSWLNLIGFRRSYEVYTEACRNGHIHILIWGQHMGMPVDSTLMYNAVEAGQFSTVKWLHENWPHGNTHTQTLSSISAAAAHRGHFDILKWLVEKGYPCDETTCISAAQGGHLDILKWLRCEDEESISVQSGTLRVGMQRPTTRWDETTARIAAINGHVDVLKWALDHGAPYDISLLADVAIASTTFCVEVLKYLVTFDPTLLTTDACSYAATSGNLEALKWLRIRGCPWNEEACVSAAQNGHLEVLKWLRAADDLERQNRGDICPWTSEVYHEARYNNRREIMAWIATQPGLE